MAVKHKTLPPGTDRPGFGGITPSLYAEEHSFSGGAQGSVLTRNTLNSDGAGWVAAADGVLMSTGVGVLPTFSATLSNTIQNNITRVGTLVAGATGAGFTIALSTSTVTGSLADARLSANVPLLNAANAFTVANKFTVNNTATTALSVRFSAATALLGIGIANSTPFPYLGFNTVSQASSDVPKYDINGFAAQLRLDSGALVFNYAPSGTAGNAITFTEGLRISNAGLLTVGAVGTHTIGGGGTSTNSFLVINGANASGMGGALRIDKNGSASATSIYLGHTSTLTGAGTSSNLMLYSGAGIVFNTNDSTNTRFAIGTTGDWLVGASLHVMDSVGTPTISSGFGITPSITGIDSAFIVMLGASPGSTGVISFGHTTYSAAPTVIACYGNNVSGAPGGQTVSVEAVSTSGCTLRYGSTGTILAGDKIFVMVRGF